MRLIKFTALALLGAMLVTAHEAPAPVGRPERNSRAGRRVQKRAGFASIIGSIGKVASSAGSTLSRNFAGFGGKAAATAGDAAGAAGAVAKGAAGAADDTAKFAAKATTKTSVLTVKDGKVVASATGGSGKLVAKDGEKVVKSGFLERNGITNKKLVKEFAVATGVGLAINGGFTAFLSFRAHMNKKQVEKNAQIAVDLAAKGQLTEEKAASLGFQFDEITGILLLPPGLDIVPPANSNPIDPNAPAGAAGTGTAANNAAAGDAIAKTKAPKAPKVDKAKELADAKKAVQLACTGQLTSAQAKALGCAYDEKSGNLSVPSDITSQLDVDAICNAATASQGAAAGGAAAGGAAAGAAAGSGGGGSKAASKKAAAASSLKPISIG